MHVFSYFPTFIYREEKPDLVNSTLGFCEEHYEHITQQQAELDVFQTYDLRQDDRLFSLREFFRQSATDILKEQGYIVSDGSLYVSSMWAQKIKRHGHHLAHVHANSLINGLFFLETPENGSYPIFSDPRAGKLMCDLPYERTAELKQCSAEVHFDNVIPGTFLLSNSWLPHSFSYNNSEHETKFVHFMLSVKGE
jgi:uncharacterized protein (TIGR02466 family)